MRQLQQIEGTWIGWAKLCKALGVVFGFSFYLILTMYYILELSANVINALNN